MSATTVATQTERQIARPLRVLVPLIKEDLQQGDEAAEAAGMPFYTAAGQKLIEAREGNDLKGGAFYDWAERNFQRSRRTISNYIDLAEASGRARAKSFKSIKDFERRHLKRYIPTSGAVRRDWTAPVDDLAEKARQEAARIQDEHLTREKERQAEHQLAMRLIDIGYKVLAKELHPDKGGSKDAMARLGRVRDRLKSHA